MSGVAHNTISIPTFLAATVREGGGSESLANSVRTSQKQRFSSVHIPVQSPVHSPVQSPESSFYTVPCQRPSPIDITDSMVTVQGRLVQGRLVQGRL